MWDAAVGSALDRRTTFVALGGGVVGDMTGFAAAAYQRGVHFLQARHHFTCAYPLLILMSMASGRRQCHQSSSRYSAVCTIAQRVATVYLRTLT